MDFELTEEQTALREVSRDILADTSPPEAVRERADHGPDVLPDLWRRGAGMGWTALLAPAEAGGDEQGITEICLVAEELGRAAAAGPFLETALAAKAAMYGSDAAKLAHEFAAGSLGAALAAGPGLGVTSGTGGLVLNGRTPLVASAGRADWILVPVDSQDPALLLVPATQALLTPRATLDLSRSWYDVSFDEVAVPSGFVLTRDPAEVHRLVDTAAVLTAADALGAGRRLLALTIEHVRTRHQFDRALGSFQAVKHKVADMHIDLMGLQAATYYAAMAIDAGTQDATLAAAVAKAHASEAMPRVAGEALQLHGGIGFTWEHDLHLWIRRIKVDALLHGSADAHHERVLDLLLLEDRTRTTR